jgi:hypothetical protein
MLHLQTIWAASSGLGNVRSDPYCPSAADRTPDESHRLRPFIAVKTTLPGVQPGTLDDYLYQIRFHHGSRAVGPGHPGLINKRAFAK